MITVPLSVFFAFFAALRETSSFSLPQLPDGAATLGRRHGSTRRVNVAAPWAGIPFLACIRLVSHRNAPSPPRLRLAVPGRVDRGPGPDGGSAGAQSARRPTPPAGHGIPGPVHPHHSPAPRSRPGCPIGPTVGVRASGFCAGTRDAGSGPASGHTSPPHRSSARPSIRRARLPVGYGCIGVGCGVGDGSAGGDGCAVVSSVQCHPPLGLGSGAGRPAFPSTVVSGPPRGSTGSGAGFGGYGIPSCLAAIHR